MDTDLTSSSRDMTPNKFDKYSEQLKVKAKVNRMSTLNLDTAQVAIQDQKKAPLQSTASKPNRYGADDKVYKLNTNNY